MHLNAFEEHLQVPSTKHLQTSYSLSLGHDRYCTLRPSPDTLCGMAKARNRVVDYTVYVIVRMVIAFLRALPYSMACKAGDGLAWLVRTIDKHHRQVARENLQHAFPDTPARRWKSFVANVYRHFCRMIVEIVHLDRRIHITNWRSYLRIRLGGGRRQSGFFGTFLCGRPVLLVTPHFGNWEFSSYVMGLLGFKIFAIARPLDNPYLDNWMRRWREATGQKMIAKKGEYEKIEQVLKAGNVLGTLGDQDAGARGMFVNFFQSTRLDAQGGGGLLAIEYNVPMMVLGAARVGEPMRCGVYVEDIIDPSDYTVRADATKAITERFTQALERLIRRHPEQYFWAAPPAGSVAAGAESQQRREPLRVLHVAAGFSLRSRRRLQHCGYSAKPLRSTHSKWLTSSLALLASISANLPYQLHRCPGLWDFDSG